MVVVAIVGILSAIAIPNYRRYQARARQSEAKLYLSSSYTAEQGFFADKGTFTTCLAKIGADAMASGMETPSGGARRYYSWGYNGLTSGSPGFHTCGPKGTTACNTYVYSGVTGLSQCDHQWWLASAAANNTEGLAGISQLPAYAHISGDTFIVPAIGSIAIEPIADVWTINQNKTLVNSQPGI